MVDSYVCLDIETTGLNPKTDKIIEIGAVKIINGQETGRFESFVNPGRHLEDKIVELTGITDEKIQNAPYIDEILPDFLNFAEDFTFLGHSVLFDFSFLKKAAVNQKLILERQGIDTLKLARKFLPELESRSLTFLCQYYRIPHKAHRAMEDAAATVKLYENLSGDFLVPETEEDFRPKPLIFQIKRETPVTKAQKERLLRLLQKHSLSMEINIDKMTKNEASRYMDRILARYGR